MHDDAWHNVANNGHALLGGKDSVAQEQNTKIAQVAGQQHTLHDTAGPIRRITVSNPRNLLGLALLQQ